MNIRKHRAIDITCLSRGIIESKICLVRCKNYWCKSNYPYYTVSDDKVDYLVSKAYSSSSANGVLSIQLEGDLDER